MFKDEGAIRSRFRWDKLPFGIFWQQAFKMEKCQVSRVGSGAKGYVIFHRFQPIDFWDLFEVGEILWYVVLKCFRVSRINMSGP